MEISAPVNSTSMTTEAASQEVLVDRLPVCKTRRFRAVYTMKTHIWDVALTEASPIRKQPEEVPRAWPRYLLSTPESPWSGTSPAC